MSYRYHIHALDKDFYNNLRQCEIVSEVKSHCYNHGDISYADLDDEDEYIAPYHFGEEIYDFGEDVLGWKSIEPLFVNFFKSDELNKEYEHYDVKCFTKEMLKLIIDAYQDHIIEMYEHLVKGDSFWNFENERIAVMSEEDRVKYANKQREKHISDQLYSWKFMRFNLNDKDMCLNNSWLYEMSVFNLIYIYKTLDWDNKKLIFFGW